MAKGQAFPSCLVYVSLLLLLLSLQDKRNVHGTVYLNITSLCSGSDPFPQMQIEDAVLRAGNETDQYCVLTFQTPSEMQYLMLRFEDLSLGCTDHFVIFDGPHAIGKSRMDVSCQHNRTSVGTLFTQSNYVTFKYTTDTLRQTNSGFTLILTAFQDFRHLCKQFE